MRAPRRVAIVGCGYTGASALYQLVHRYPVKEIVVFEKAAVLGPGFPYQQGECADYLMNTPSDLLGLAPWSRGGFLEWCQSQPGYDPADHDCLQPRQVFGRFLAQAVRETLRVAAEKRIPVTIVHSEVTDVVEPESGGVVIRWAGGQTDCDVAILATGRCPAIERPEMRQVGQRAQYFPSHVLNHELDSIPLDATCHVLGTSLSAYDVLNRLFSPSTGCRFTAGPAGLTFSAGPNARRVVLCSRSGRLKKVESPKARTIVRSRLTREHLEAMGRGPGLTLNDCYDLVREEAALHGAQIDWSEVISPYAGCDSAAAVTHRAAALLESDIRRACAGGEANFLVDLIEDVKPLLWEIFAERWLQPESERTYRRDFETVVLSYAAPCPIPIAQRILALLRAGRLEVRRNVGTITPVADGAAYQVPHEFGTDWANVLIDATGRVDRRIGSARQGPLVTAMSAQGTHMPYEVDGIATDGVSVDMTSFRATGSRAIFVANMFLWGPGFFTSSAFRMSWIVDRILRALYVNEGEGRSSL